MRIVGAMTTAILLQPPVLVTADLPACFADPIDEAALREWLAHPRASKHLVAVPPGTRFDDAVGRALGATPDPSKVTVVYVAGHALLDAADVEALGLAQSLLQSVAALEERTEVRVAAATEAFDVGRWDEARALLTDLTERLGSEASSRHADVLAMLGEIERLQGRTEGAVAALDRALSMAPDHDEALRSRASIARSTGEHAIAAATLHRLVDHLSEPAQRAEVLSTIATESLEAARVAVQSALESRPGDLDLLEQRRIISELAGNWADAVGARVQLAESLENPTMRARAFVEAADIARTRCADLSRAVALYEAAIEDDPAVEGAFERVEAALASAGDPTGLAAAYERQIERLTAQRDERGSDEEASAAIDDARIDLLSRLADVYENDLDDLGSAIHTLDRIAAERPSDVESRVRLARLLEASDQPGLAIRCLELAAASAPFRASTYRDAHRLFSRIADDDRSFAAAAALVALGEADVNEQLAYAQFAPEAPIRPTRPFDDAVWATLAPGDHDAEVDAIVAAVEPAAVGAWLAAREDRGTLSKPDPKLLQDPESSTVTAVRSFVWAARLLGVPTPAVYADATNARVAVATVPARTEAVVIGRSVLTGRSAVELAFLAARHLAYARPGWRAVAYFRSSDELTTIVRGAASLARPDLVAPASLDPASLDVVRRLEPGLGQAGRDALGDALERLVSSRRRLDLARWMRSIETMACRAALLAAGDVTVAAHLLSVAGALGTDVTARDRTRDLLPFSIGAKYADLRSTLGVSVGGG